jgi:hypothetical protein
MDVIIEDVVKNNYLTPFKITPEQVKETVNHETAKKTMDFSGYTVILFLKKFDTHYILVDARSDPSLSSLLISSAFIIDQLVIKNISIDNPLAVLEQFAKEFGAEITIRDQKSKFIYDARIVIPIENPRNVDIAKALRDNISLSENGSPAIGNYLGDMLLRPQVLGDKIYVDIALIYYINTKKYSQYLKSNNFI